MLEAKSLIEFNAVIESYAHLIRLKCWNNGIEKLEVWISAVLCCFALFLGVRWCYTNHNLSIETDKIQNWRLEIDFFKLTSLSWRLEMTGFEFGSIAGDMQYSWHYSDYSQAKQRTLCVAFKIHRYLRTKFT